jgi:hypothetical protein
MSGRLPPQRLEIFYRAVGQIHIFTARQLPGFHLAGSQLRLVFDMIGPSAQEMVRRITGIGLDYHSEVSYPAFMNRSGLMAALRGAKTGLDTGLVQNKFLSQRRLVHALHALGAQDIGGRDRHLHFWSLDNGAIFSVMAPFTRTQSGGLLYPETYVRDLLAMVARLKQSGLGDDHDGMAADIVLRADPL